MVRDWRAYAESFEYEIRQNPNKIWTAREIVRTINQLPPKGYKLTWRQIKYFFCYLKGYWVFKNQSTGSMRYYFVKR